MKISRLSLVVGTGVAVALCAAGPAVATPHPHLTPTSITVKATHGDTAPKHKVSLTATLKAGKQHIADETLYLESRTRTTHAWSDPAAIGATDTDGHVVVPVTPGNGKGAKTQYRVVFQGDSTYKHSHSSVITVTAS